MTSQPSGSDRLTNLPASDVCVVGAGPAGIALARALGQAGHSVTLLESGMDGRARFESDLNDGDVDGERYDGLRRTRARGFGGTTNIWNVEVGSKPGAKFTPLDPADLRTWPFGWEELAPFYRAAQEVCGLGAFAYDAADWVEEGRAPFDLGGTGLTSRVYQFGSSERFTRELRAELVALGRVHVVTGATVVGLMLDRTRTRALGVHVADQSGAVQDVRAARVVLACGAVENARLLLLTDALPPDGWLGRGFMEHARDFSPVLVPDSPAVFDRASFYDMQTARCGTQIGGRLGVQGEAIAHFDIPNAAVTLIPRTAAGSRGTVLQRAIRRLTSPRAGAAPASRYGWSRRPRHALAEFGMVVNLEQRPDPRNRITLGARRDRHGNPLPHLALSWSAVEQDRLDRLRGLLATWFRDAGLGTLRYVPGRRPDLNAHHHAGTTRMGRAIDDGVVDPNGAVFGLENLYVTGASVMPTAGFANPTLTIVALAVRLAQHLAASGLARR